MKKLIYFTIGFNKNYIKLANICIDSLYKSGYNGDILIIGNMEDELLENIDFNGNVYFHNVDKTNLEFSSANKILIYEYDRIDEYDKIIYCDLDCVWLGNPDEIFNRIQEDKLYVTIDATGLLMSQEYDFYGYSLLEEKEIEEIELKEIFGFCAGFFAFNKNMVKHFKNVNDFITSNIDKLNGCVEQKFLNVYFYRNGLYNTTSLSDLIRHDGYSLPSFNGVLLHFPGGVGNFETKFEKMSEYLSIRENNKCQN